MRDGNRLKEKIEIRLDRRQVTTLSVIALLLSASVFALGVMVGKNLSLQSRAAGAPQALLDRLDAEGEAGAPVAPTEPLTFQEELTRKLPKPTVAPPAALRLAVAKTPGKEAADALRIGEQAGLRTSGTATATIDSGLAALPPLPAPPVAMLPDPPESDSGVEVAVVTKVSPAARSFFTVQVKATQSSGEADKFAQKLRAQGFQPLVAEADVGGKGHWYRVRVGRFDSRPQADRYLLDFKRETKLEAFVTAAGH